MRRKIKPCRAGRAILENSKCIVEPETFVAKNDRQFYKVVTKRNSLLGRGSGKCMVRLDDICANNEASSEVADIIEAPKELISSNSCDAKDLVQVSRTILDITFKYAQIEYLGYDDTFWEMLERGGVRTIPEF